VDQPTEQVAAADLIYLAHARDWTLFARRHAGRGRMLRERAV
jgi:hypothetical protein